MCTLVYKYLLYVSLWAYWTINGNYIHVCHDKKFKLQITELHVKYLYHLLNPTICISELNFEVLIFIDHQFFRKEVYPLTNMSQYKILVFLHLSPFLF